MGFFPFAPAPTVVTPPLALTAASSAAPIFSVTDTQAAPAVPQSQFTGQAAGDLMMGFKVAADAQERLSVDDSGTLRWGSGAGAADVVLKRSGANALQLTAGNLFLSANGAALFIKSGANSTLGSGTLTGGTVTIANTAVTAGSFIFLTDTANGTNLGTLSVGTIIGGTSFGVNSSNPLDAGTFNFLILQPG
jgi:hypothetical protein